MVERGPQNYYPQIHEFEGNLRVIFLFGDSLVSCVVMHHAGCKVDKNNKFLYQAKLNGKFTDLNSYNDLLLNITNPNKPVKIEIPSSD